MQRVGSLCYGLTVVLLLGWGLPANLMLAPTQQDVVAALLSYVNAARVTEGLPPYALNPLLVQVTQSHSEYQRDIGHWSHEGPGGSLALDRALAAGYPASRVNENVYASISGPEETVNWWLTADEAHRDNVLHPALREVGFGAATDSNGVTYYTMNISAQPNVLPVFINNDAPSTSSQYVTLTLTNEEIFLGGSGRIGRATQVLVSNFADFSDAAPQPWAQTLPWALDVGDGVGSKTVYVRYIDPANRTASAQDSILLTNLSAPPTTIPPTLLPTALPFTSPTPLSLSPTSLPATPTSPPPPTIPMSATPTSSEVAISLPTTSRSAAVTPIIERDSAEPARMLFAGLLVIGLGAIGVGMYLLVRPER